MLYESIANALVESVNADKEKLAYTLVLDTLADANDRNEVWKILAQGVKERISNPDTEERLIAFISRIHKDPQLEQLVKTQNLSSETLALYEQIKTRDSQLEKYKSQLNKCKSGAWVKSLIVIISLLSVGAAVWFAIMAYNSQAPTKAALEESSQKYSALNTKHDALNKEFTALQSQNQELLKGNQELEKAFEPIKQENQRLAEQYQAAEDRLTNVNNRLSRVCKRKRNRFFNPDCE